jgi:hypothetical protein
MMAVITKASGQLVYVPARSVSLRNAGFDEAWLEHQITTHPEILELHGSPKSVRSQVQHKSGGRLDCLLKDDENQKFYAVELMLGELDADHITRALDYFLAEKSREEASDWEHIAVIVAEQIQNSRYVRVVDYLSKHIPLIAIELSALQVGDNLTLKCTKLFDGTIEGEGEIITGGEIYTREYWLKRASPATIELIDGFLPILQAFASDTNLTYKKYFIGLSVGNRAENYLTFDPRKEFLQIDARVSDVELWAKRLRESGFPLAKVLENEDRVRFRITSDLFNSHRQLIQELCEDSYKQWFE